MNVPEELRNISFASYPLTVGSWEGPVRAVRLDHLESWFASHELVDLSVCGPQCPAWRIMVGAPRCMATFETLTPEEDSDYDARIENAPVGQPCPVMARKLRRPLLATEFVHHINGDRQDNRPENLQLMTNSGHMIAHMAERSLEEKQELAERGVAAYQRRNRQPRALIACACGCGAEIETPDARGRPRRFVVGHNQRGKHWRVV